MQITYANDFTAEYYNELRKSVGWMELQSDLAQKGLENTAFLIAAYDNDLPVGMARVITDYGYIVFIADVIVRPDYQGKGIGREMMTQVMKYINENIAVGQCKLINLISANGKEKFYNKFGFEARPNEMIGEGMIQWIKK
jgi:predicted N-acetyltransferase YhbS